MPRIKYKDIKLGVDRLAVIAQANRIIAEYSTAGFDLTLRQLYYQFVARGLIQNRDAEYKKLGSTINDGRLAGLVDWHAIVDRTRNLRDLSHWDDPSDIIASAAASYRNARWTEQPVAVEVWIEKDALVGVIEGVCHEFDVPHFSCRGYTSQSEMWVAAQRIRARSKANGQATVILHFGDHDPSGIDMTRDITDRLDLFGAPMEVRRLALNMDQVDQYSPPPNPAKITDSRASGYIQTYGHESWELDALDPPVLVALVRSEIEKLIEREQWDADAAKEQRGRDLLEAASSKWDGVVDYLEAERGLDEESE